MTGSNISIIPKQNRNLSKSYKKIICSFSSGIQFLLFQFITGISEIKGNKIPVRSRYNSREKRFYAIIIKSLSEKRFYVLATGREVFRSAISTRYTPPQIKRIAKS